jgi:hypothetical protein
MIEQILAESQKRKIYAMAMPRMSVWFKSRSGSGNFYAVTPCFKNAGKWRVTCFDAEGPAGHVENKTYVEAIQEAWLSGADIYSPQEIEET